MFDYYYYQNSIREPILTPEPPIDFVLTKHLFHILVATHISREYDLEKDRQADSRTDRK